MSEPTELRPFHEAFFLDELNRFVGSGAEILVKGRASEENATRMEVGDRLIGIGVTHIVESLSRPPGIDSYRAVNPDVGLQTKTPTRAFRVTGKQRVAEGYAFDFEPLHPEEFSQLLHDVSDGEVSIPADSIPEGTMVLSFLQDRPLYTLAETSGPPGNNWVRATTGYRHWNIGVHGSDDFWWATFPSDDIGILRTIAPSERVGSIRFGLSLLAGGVGFADLERVECLNPSGDTSRHHFCLSGYATGTHGLRSPFPIGLRTEVLFRPVSSSESY